MNFFGNTIGDAQNESMLSDEEFDDEIDHQIIQIVGQNPPRIERVPIYDSQMTGMNWIMELINGRPTRIHHQFRMSASVFTTLCDLLYHHYELRGSGNVSHIECVAIFLFLCAQGGGYRQASERFQRSLAVISSIFHVVLEVMQSFVVHQIRADNVNAQTHPHIRYNRMYYPHFRNCIGGMDGTHIKARLRRGESVPFIGRIGTPTQNVLAICDFDMCFTYVSAGWEGSMHDARIFGIVSQDESYNFPTPPEGKYYLVDSGYPNMKGYLAPYKNERYHLQTFEDGRDPQNANEIFNKAHASLRSVIERTFGVWKNRWRILDKMTFLELPIQSKIVVATMALHNFIRRTDINDLTFQMRVPRTSTGRIGESSSSSTGIRNDAYMENVRDEIRHSICGISH